MSELEREVREEQAKSEGKDPRFAELERLASELHSEGIDFRVERGEIIQAIHDRDRDRETSIDLGSNHLRIAAYGDPHLGSKFEQLTAFRSFHAYAESQKADLIVDGGDVTQGPDEMHRGMVHEVHAHGADAQVDYAIDVYPTSSVPKYVISGNHDDSHLKQGGVNVVRRICDRRKDMTYLGQDAAYFNIGALRTYVVHPDGGGSYAKSYKPQKLVESLPPEKGVQIAFIAHYHQYGAFRVGNTFAFMLPCFQSQYAWLARKGLHPDIGGLLLDVWMDDAGRIARIAHEFVNYEPREEDWDEPASRRVSRAWSSRGLEVA